MCHHPRTIEWHVEQCYPWECADEAPESTTEMIFAIIILFDIMLQGMVAVLDGIHQSSPAETPESVVSPLNLFHHHRCQHQRTKKRDRADEKA